MLNEMIVSFNPFSWYTLILMFDINSGNPCSLRPLITFESNFMKSLRRCHYWCLQQNDSLSFRRIKFISLNSFILPFVLSLDLFERRTRFLFCSKPFKTRVGGKEHYHVLPSSHERVVLVFLRLNLFRKRMNEQGVNFCISATLFFLGNKFFSLRYVTPVLEVKQRKSSMSFLWWPWWYTWSVVMCRVIRLHLRRYIRLLACVTWWCHCRETGLSPRTTFFRQIMQRKSFS